MDTLLSVEQAAERLGTSVRFVRRLVEDGAVPAGVIDELMGHQAGRRGEREAP